MCITLVCDQGVVNEKYDSDIWNQMVINAAESRNSKRDFHLYICKNVSDDAVKKGRCELITVTKKEITKDHVKLKLTEIINITRILTVKHDVIANSKKPLANALEHMAARATQKYDIGFSGLIKRIKSVFANFFVRDSWLASAFKVGNKMKKRRLGIIEDSKKRQLPLFLGSNAVFARWVAKRILSN